MTPIDPSEHLLELPWGAWTGSPEVTAFEFPRQWSVEHLPMRGWGESDVLDWPALRQSVALAARDKRSASLAIEDTTRPALLADVLQAVLSGLADAGMRRDKIDIVVATGAHGPPALRELRAKVGDAIIDQFPVRWHDPNGDLVPSTVTIGKVPLRLDRIFCDAELRMGIGGIIPNPYAGFSGGGKIVLPGLAGLDALEWLHKLAMMGFAGGIGRTEGNRVRTEINRVAAELPLHFSVLCLVDERRQPRQLFWGEPTEAFERGCVRAREVYSTPMSGEYDVLFCNAYPKDAEFLQAENAYSPVRTGGIRHLTEGGSIVLMAACNHGRGVHGLFDRGMPLHRQINGPRRDMREALLHVYSPMLTEEDVRVTHWSGYPFFDRWDSLIEALVARHGQSARVGVFPAASIQLGPRAV